MEMLGSTDVLGNAAGDSLGAAEVSGWSVPVGALLPSTGSLGATLGGTAEGDVILLSSPQATSIAATTSRVSTVKNIFFIF